MLRKVLALFGGSLFLFAEWLLMRYARENFPIGAVIATGIGSVLISALLTYFMWDWAFGRDPNR